MSANDNNQNDQPQTLPATMHEDANKAALREQDPEAYAEIYGDLPAKGVTIGDPDDTGDDKGGQQAAAATAQQQPAPAQQQGQQPQGQQDDGSRGPMVPIGRLNEVLARVDALTEQLTLERAARVAGEGQQGQAAPQQTQQQGAPAFDLAAKLREKQQAVWDGNEDRVVELEMEINEYNQRVAEERAVQRLKAEGERETLLTEFNTAAATLKAEYPALDGSQPGHNADAIAEVQRQRDLQLASGAAPAVALRRAVKLVAEEYGLERVPPKVDPGNGNGNGRQQTPSAADIIAQRQVAVAGIAAQTAATPPAGVGGKGEGEVRGDAERPLSREEFAALDPKEKDRRLGLS